MKRLLQRGFGQHPIMGLVLMMFGLALCGSPTFSQQQNFPGAASGGSGSNTLVGTVDITNPSTFGGTTGVHTNGFAIEDGTKFTITSGSTAFSCSGTCNLTGLNGAAVSASTWNGNDSSYLSSASCVSTSTATTLTVLTSTTGTLSQNAT